MKSFLLLLLLLLLTATTGFAADPNEEWSYRIERVIPGYSSRLIEQNAPLGSFVLVKPQPVPSSKQTFDEAMDMQLRNRSAENERIASNRKELVLKALTSQSSPVPAPAGAASAPTPPATEGVSPKIDLAAFAECAKRSVPVLKNVLKASASGKPELLQSLLKRLDLERGDGEKTGAGGMACGKYLGKAGIPSLNSTDEIKLLSPFAVKKHEDLKEVLVAMVASRHKQAPLEASGLWASIWAELSFEAVFKEKIDSGEGVLEKLIADPVTQDFSSGSGEKSLVVHVSNSAESLRALYKSGREFAEKLLASQRE